MLAYLGTTFFYRGILCSNICSRHILIVRFKISSRFYLEPDSFHTLLPYFFPKTPFNIVQSYLISPPMMHFARHVQKKSGANGTLAPLAALATTTNHTAVIPRTLHEGTPCFDLSISFLALSPAVLPSTSVFC